MPRIEKEITINNLQGLHARPAVLFVQVANKYNSNVTIQKGNEQVNGKSIMGILTLGAGSKSKIILICEGDDAEALSVELEELLSRESIDEQ